MTSSAGWRNSSATSDRAPAGSPPLEAGPQTPLSDADGVPRRHTGLAIRSNGAFATPRFATGWNMNRGSDRCHRARGLLRLVFTRPGAGGSLAGNDSPEASSSGTSTWSGESVIHTLDLSLGVGSISNLVDLPKSGGVATRRKQNDQPEALRTYRTKRGSGQDTRTHGRPPCTAEHGAATTLRDPGAPCPGPALGPPPRARRGARLLGPSPRGCRTTPSGTTWPSTPRTTRSNTPPSPATSRRASTATGPWPSGTAAPTRPRSGPTPR